MLRRAAAAALLVAAALALFVLRVADLKRQGYAGLKLEPAALRALVQARDRPDDVLFGLSPAPRPRNTTFPLYIKFHKVAGTTVQEVLARELECSGAAAAWRPRLCGEYDTHKLSLYRSRGRAGFADCAAASDHRLFALFRDPVHRYLSMLYWYPTKAAMCGAPWNVSISEWTVADVKRMDAALRGVVRASSVAWATTAPPPNEYLDVLSGGTGDVAAAVARLDEIVVGTTERLDDFLVLAALDLGWPVERMLYTSAKTNAPAGLCCAGAPCPGAAGLSGHFAPNRGRYDDLPPKARAYIERLVAKDRRVYDAAAARHREQVRRHGAAFDAARARFASLLAAFRAGALGGVPAGPGVMDACVKRCLGAASCVAKSLPLRDAILRRPAAAAASRAAESGALVEWAPRGEGGRALRGVRGSSG